MEVGLFDLWLPILLSAVFVFIASSILHMVLPLHKSDYQKLPGEAEIMEAMRAQGVKPGYFMFPHPGSMKEAATPEVQEKYKQGPVGFMNVQPNGPPAMGKALGLWFVYSIVIGVFVAYLATLAIDPGQDDYMDVFRITGTVAILAHSFNQVSDSIWKGQSWCTTGKFFFDGLVYGLVTAGVFGWLWPS